MVLKCNAGIICALAFFIIPITVHFTPDKKIRDRYFEIKGDKAITNPIVSQSGSLFEDKYDVVQAYDDRYMLSENIDVIRKIRNNDEFQKLSYEEKCGVVNALVYNQARYLGLCEINIKYVDLGENCLGKYDHQTRTIMINSKPLKDGTLNGGSNEEVLMTVCHEARHCYQYLLAECYTELTPEQRNLYAFTSDGVDSWIDNINHYISTDEESDLNDYFEYRKQPIEVDARNWAQNELGSYFYYIDLYTK